MKNSPSLTRLTDNFNYPRNGQKRSKGTSHCKIKCFLQSWSHLLKKTLIENFISCTVCSIRGTNNQLPNRFDKFVHLQLLDLKFLFSENISQVEENSCLWTHVLNFAFSIHQGKRFLSYQKRYLSSDFRQKESN